MFVNSINQELCSYSTKVTHPTEDAVLYDMNGLKLMWDATAKWFKWIPKTLTNYNTGYLACDSSVTASLSGMNVPVRKRTQTVEADVWINSDQSVAPTSILTTNSTAIIKGSIKWLSATRVPDCDVWFEISLNLDTPTGDAADCTADSFITSKVQFSKW
jgi:hypothetical protein